MTYINELLEQVINQGTNVPNATYFPDINGLYVGMNHHITLTGTLIDGAAETTTIVVQASNDRDRTANWITPIFGYNSVLHTWVDQMSVTNATLNFAWDFDFWNYSFFRIYLTTTNPTNTVNIFARLRTY